MSKETTLNLRLTKSLKTNIKKHALRQGLTVAEYTRSILLKSQVNTIEGLTIHYESVSLVKGVVLYLLDYNGNKVALADADYTLSNGKIISVRDSRVSSANVEMKPQELSAKVRETHTLKKAKTLLEQAYINLGMELVSDRAESYKMAVTMQKNKASQGTIIDQVLALSKTLELLTDRPSRNVSELIKKINKTRDA
jgi:hypothetical protein